MKIPIFLICIPAFLLALSSCSSTGSGGISSTSIQSESRMVYVRATAENADRIPAVAAELRKAGFTVQGIAGAPYSVDVSFDGGGWSLSCTIIMYENGLPIVSAKGTNPGVGVWLARGAADNGVFKGALKQFSKKLGNRSGSVVTPLIY